MKAHAELNNINRKIIVINLIGTPGTLLIALSLYTLFTSIDEALHPILTNTAIVYGMLILGVIIEVWLAMKLIPLFKKRSTIINEQNT